jgi:hypothetical protein
MRFGLATLVILLSSGCLFSRQDTAMARQCSALREIIYQANHSRFKNLMDQRTRHSEGYQPNGKWTFSHEQFSTHLPWANAAKTYIEHATDDRDTLFTETWQYIALFNPMADALNASRYFQLLVTQLNGCPLPIADTAFISLLPVAPDALPPNKPDNLIDAYLFDLPAVFGEDRAANIMLGLEKVKQGYRPVLMIEWMEEKRRKN